MSKPNKKPVRLHLKVKGRVQGVYYRAWTQETAQNLGLTGWTRNLADGSVEIMAEGPRDVLETFLNQCYQGPVRAQVKEILSSWEKPQSKSQTFEIRYGA